MNRLCCRLLTLITTLLICIGLTPSAFALNAEATMENSVLTAEGITLNTSHAEDGILYAGNSSVQPDKGVKLAVTGPNKVCQMYDLTYFDDGVSCEVFPLTSGSGTYSLTVYRQLSGTSYQKILTTRVDVCLTNEAAPFLCPNQRVAYAEDSAAVKTANALLRDCESDDARIATVYDYVLSALTYSYERAEAITSGYISDADAVLADGKAVCLDYATLMAVMLRSQGIPTKLLYGYAGGRYHAWVSVFTQDAGWTRYDPTFADSAGASVAMMRYIANDANYSVRYSY